MNEETTNQNEKYLFETASVPHALAVMALPAVVSQLITLIYNLADTWFIGRTNNSYMVACPKHHAGLHIRCSYGTIGYTVPPGAVLCYTTYVFVLFYGAFYTGDRTWKRVLLAGSDPAAGL